MSKEKTAELLRTLEQGVSDVFTSERFKDYLNCVAKFYKYSYMNTILILSQNKNASLVAGFKKWNEMGRYVKKGERGIAILAPGFTTKTPVKDTNGKYILDNEGNQVMSDGEKRLSYFMPVYVFDLSQTDGEPLPMMNTGLEGEVDNYDKLFDALAEISPYPVSFEKLTDEDNGYCNYKHRKIVLSDTLSQTHALKTLVHEIAHAKMHVIYSTEERDKVDNKLTTDMEVEAEGVAYAVCQHLGIDTSSYSFDYIALWSKRKGINQLKSALQIISKETNEMITRISDTLTREHEAARVVCDR